MQPEDINHSPVVCSALALSCLGTKCTILGTIDKNDQHIIRETNDESSSSLMAMVQLECVKVGAFPSTLASRPWPAGIVGVAPYSNPPK
jgi:hypothetical protein